MRHLKAINEKAERIERLGDELRELAAASREPVTPEPGAPEPGERDVVALQEGGGPAPGPHIPLGCSFVFSPGWEADSKGGTAGLCQPVERDLFDCYITCFWPAHVPDLYNYAPDWTSKCASAQKDWRKIDLIFP